MMKQRVKAMRMGLICLVAVPSALLLNSCAVTGGLFVGGATVYAIHQEAKAHFPDKVPSLPNFFSFSSIFESSADHNAPKSSLGIKDEFGFNCTKKNNDMNQSGCFDLFARSLSKKEDSSKIRQKGMMSKGDRAALVKDKNYARSSKKTQDISKKVVVSQEEIEESAFFENAGTNWHMKQPKITKKQQVAQVLRKNPEVSKLDTRSQEIFQAVTKLNQSPEFVSSHLLKWIKAWQNQDINAYISFYSEDFTGTKRSHSEWEAQRHRALKKHSNISIEVSNIQIHQGTKTIEINFLQHFKSDSFSDIGIKELIWAKNKDGWKIIKETWVPKEKNSRAKEANNSKNFVSSQLVNWVNAWKNQNIKLYMSFYSKNFIGTKKSRVEWETHRNRALKANSNMSIQVNNIQLEKNAGKIELNFSQRFKSDRFSSVGIKELVWKKTGNGWKIFKETWIQS